MVYSFEQSQLSIPTQKKSFLFGRCQTTAQKKHFYSPMQILEVVILVEVRYRDSRKVKSRAIPPGLAPLRRPCMVKR